MITFDVSGVTTREQAALELGMAEINRTKEPPLANITEYLDYKIHQDIITNLADKLQGQKIQELADKYNEADDTQKEEIFTKIREVIPDKIKEEEELN